MPGAVVVAVGVQLLDLDPVAGPARWEVGQLAAGGWVVGREGDILEEELVEAGC